MNAPARIDRLMRGIDYEIREGKPGGIGGDDLAFVLDSWRWSTLHAAPAHGVAKDVHFAEMTPRVLAAIMRSRVKLAHDVSDETTLLGWCALEGTTLHYVLVRRDYRGQGIARELLAGEPVAQYSAKTAARFRGAPAGWTYNPWAFVPLKET